MDQIPGAMVTMSLAGGYLTQLVVNAFTIGFPSRPSWVGPILAIVFGVISCSVVALATMPATAPLDRQLFATILGAGLLAGGGAMGGNAINNTAKAKRDEDQAPGPRRY